ncbi:H-2 class I histocompatibility antigen, D-37 alpha chain-like [Labeo rohita]|uniref:H-2 class I histocompatibility antigen, D-37 alpha chain-like n=1 Tax=Labeo rohita TaxID=84645 RepID=UPI0021E2FFD3|nr:H-2 class I histocompatibility antigen, D-37 alpha chain-like [Labeo rohita]
MQICSDRACEIKRTKTVVVLSFKTFSVRKRMFWGILLFPFLLVSPQSNEKQEKHFLHYMYTVLTKAGPFPEFSAVGESDDRRIAHYSIEEQGWIRENLTVDDWNEAPELPENSDWFLNYLYDLSKCKRHAECSEFHILQRIIGCELEKLNGTVMSLRAFDESAYDGKDFSTCKYDLLHWIDKDIETKTDHRTGRIDFLMNCTKWISTFNSTYKSRPDVYVFARKAPDHQNKLNLTCLTTGFYPKNVEMNIRLDRSVLGKQIFSEIRPNADGSFQLRSTVKIDRNHKGSYDCFVIHSSLTEPVSVEWDGKCSDCETVPSHSVAAGVAVAAFLVCLIVIVCCIYKIRKSNGAQGYQWDI